MLPGDVVNKYLEPLTPSQREAVTQMRLLIFEICPTLVEEIDQGKWFGGLLTYNTTDGLFAFALGPRGEGLTTFHMMPYYGSPLLQQRHSAVLKKFLTGKSCIRFQNFADLPEEALRDILSSTEKMREMAVYA